jgi:hypothetical protein
LRRSAGTHRNEGIDIVRATPDETVERARRIRSEVQRFAIVDPPLVISIAADVPAIPRHETTWKLTRSKLGSLGSDSACLRTFAQNERRKVFRLLGEIEAAEQR